MSSLHKGRFNNKYTFEQINFLIFYQYYGVVFVLKKYYSLFRNICNSVLMLSIYNFCYFSKLEKKFCKKIKILLVLEILS